MEDNVEPPTRGLRPLTLASPLWISVLRIKGRREFLLLVPREHAEESRHEVGDGYTEVYGLLLGNG